MKFLRVITALIVFWPVMEKPSHAQNYAGLRQSAIIKLIGIELPEFSKQNGIINDTHKYLRYETDDGLQTLLVFLDDKDICHEVRLNFDESVLKEKMKEFDTKYNRINDSTWIDKKRGKEFTISLKDETWYYSASIRQAVK
ncbi:MAG: hypothetical protein IH591_16945 [Bacteroidales bacterium]|nr:hypothetical protein [Bacteroidales bacterium]